MTRAVTIFLFPALADSLGLARASTSSEKLLSGIQQGLISLPLAWWAGSAMLASKAASAGPSMTQAAGTILTSGRAADVTSTVGSSVATVAAQASGAGPVATTIAGMAGGVGGGAVAGVKPKGGAAQGATVLHGTGKAKGLTFANRIEQSTWLQNAETVAKRMDKDGFVDIAGMKIQFGKKNAAGQWENVNDLFKHTSVEDLEKSITRGRADADALHGWFTSQVANPPYPGAPAGDRLRAACSGTINGKPIVIGQDGKPAFGQGVKGETSFISRNQNAIAPDKRSNKPTLISNEVVELGKKEYPDKTRFPSDTIDNSHAEVAFMQNAYDAGLIKAGDNITIPVTGRPVCRFCRVHLPLIAEKTGVRFITVIDKSRGKFYYWHQGMNSMRALNK